MDLEKTEELKAKIAALSAQADQTKELSVLYKELGEAYNKINEHEKALESFQEAQEKLVSSGEEDPELKAAIHYESAFALGNSEQLPDAMDQANLAVSIYRAVENQFGLAQSLRRKGSIQINMGMVNEGLESLNEALDTASLGDHFEEQGKVKAMLGDMEMIAKNFKQAIAKYQESLPLFEKANTKDLQAESYMKIGQILIMHHKLEQALEIYELAVDAYLDAGQEAEAANVYKVMAKTLESNGKNEQARKYFGQAAEEFGEVGDCLQQADCLFQIGYLHETDKDAVSAQKFYAKALPIAQESGDEMLIDTITDAYESLQEKIDRGKIKLRKQAPTHEDSDASSSAAQSQSKPKSSGLFSRLKDIFGNK